MSPSMINTSAGGIGGGCGDRSRTLRGAGGGFGSRPMRCGGLAERITPYDPAPPDAEWRLSIEFPDYEVSEYGHVRRYADTANGSFKKGFYLKPNANHYGYPQLRLKRADGTYRTRPVHRLVGLAFLAAPPPGIWHLAHSDGSRDFCHYTNLRWTTPKENSEDMVRHQSHKFGSAHPNAKLTEAAVLEILAQPAQTVSELARTYGVDRRVIQRIRKGVAWKSASSFGGHCV